MIVARVFLIKSGFAQVMVEPTKSSHIRLVFIWFDLKPKQSRIQVRRPLGEPTS
jgi:hypothetical protein